MTHISIFLLFSFSLFPSTFNFYGFVSALVFFVADRKKILASRAQLEVCIFREKISSWLFTGERIFFRLSKKIAD